MASGHTCARSRLLIASLGRDNSAIKISRLCAPNSIGLPRLVLSLSLTTNAEGIKRNDIFGQRRRRYADTIIMMSSSAASVVIQGQTSVLHRRTAVGSHGSIQSRDVLLRCKQLKAAVYQLSITAITRNSTRLLRIYSRGVRLRSTEITHAGEMYAMAFGLSRPKGLGGERDSGCLAQRF
jgi:hypothetical protein